MRIIIFLCVLFVTFPAVAGGRYEKKKAGECVVFDAICLDMEAMATLASEHEKVVLQCKLDMDKMKEQFQVVRDGLKLSYEAEIKKKDQIIEILKKPVPEKPRSVWPYVLIGGGGIVVGAATTLILFLVR